MTSRMLARATLAALLACFAAGACSGTPPGPVDYTKMGPTRSLPRDDNMGPALRGNAGS